MPRSSLFFDAPETGNDEVHLLHELRLFLDTLLSNIAFHVHHSRQLHQQASFAHIVSLQSVQDLIFIVSEEVNYLNVLSVCDVVIDCLQYIIQVLCLYFRLFDILL